MGSCGSNRITRFHRVYTSGASAIGVPGWPDLACCTASMDSVRIVLMHSRSSSAAVVAGLSTGVLLMAVLRFQRRHFRESAQMARFLAERRVQERVNHVPRERRTDDAAAHADDVHVIVLDALSRREVILHEPGAHAVHFVGADGGIDAAAADRNP